MKTLSFFLLFLIANSAIAACVDLNTGVVYDLYLSQHPEMDCQQAIAHGNLIPNTLQDVEFKKDLQIQILNGLKSKHCQMKSQVMSGEIEFDQSAFDALHEEMAALQLQVDELEKLRSEMWKRDFNDRVARQEYKHSQRLKAISQAAGVDKQYEQVLKNKRTQK